MNFLRSSLGRSSSSEKGNLDFDEEARALWARLNLDYNNRSSSVWSPADPIWRHPGGEGYIYVGNQAAAENLTYLKGLNITHIVNCTYGFSKIPNFHEGKLSYYNFPISHWPNFVDGSDSSIIDFTKPLFEFIEGAVSKRGSVLIHCLAGAHRAGTTGCACLIHFAGMDMQQAISAAKKCRSIIDPIGQLPEFLRLLHLAYQRNGGPPGIRMKQEITDAAVASKTTKEEEKVVETTEEHLDRNGEVK